MDRAYAKKAHGATAHLEPFSLAFEPGVNVDALLLELRPKLVEYGRIRLYLTRRDWRLRIPT